MENLKIADLLLDMTIYPRNEISSQAVAMLVDAIECGEELPPITVAKEDKRVVDGFHRIRAFKKLGKDTIEAFVKSYATEADLFADAVRLNRSHGRALDSYDIRRAIQRLLELGYVREAIADVVRIPAPRVDEMIRGFASNGGNNAVPLKRGLMHMAGKKLTKQQRRAVENYSGMEGTYHANQLLLLLDQKLWKDTPQFRAAMDRLVSKWVSIAKASIH